MTEREQDRPPLNAPDETAGRALPPEPNTRPIVRRPVDWAEPEYGKLYQVRFHRETWEAIQQEGWFIAEDTTASGGHVRISVLSGLTEIEVTDVEDSNDVIVMCIPRWMPNQ